MPVLAEVEFPGVTALQYEEANHRAGFGPEHPPAGLLSHAAVITNEGLRLVNVWQSAQALEAFMEIMLPAAKESGFPEPSGPPRIAELYNFVVP
ncbi:hypothetical protein ACFYYN_02020 [Streptomyces sp. NPDC001902]|nr:hypothetical protein [Streptomyces sp. PA03-1a]MDX2707397.1 hypothetical protein [Streptomyces sp. PA03-6a]MDX2811986.1 hypothetical protein [Streptomyces sp. PA03-5A]